MASFSVYNLQGEKVGTVEQPALFSTAVDEKLIHRYLTWVRTMMRSTLGHTKTRGEVSGGGKKPWRQKGTGRARVGSTRSPLWRKGGIVFGPLKEQNFETRMPRTERRKALFSAFASKAQADKVVVLDNWEMDKPQTKAVVKTLASLPITQGSKVLHIHGNYMPTLFYSTRNLPTVNSKTIQHISIQDLLNHDVLLITKEGLNQLETHFTSES